MSGEIVSFPSERWIHQGGDGWFTTSHRENNIWLLFDVDKLPSAPKTKLVSLTLHAFFRGPQTAKNLLSWESQKDKEQVIAPSCQGMIVWDVMRSTERGREKKRNESESLPRPLFPFLNIPQTAINPFNPFNPWTFTSRHKHKSSS